MVRDLVLLDVTPLSLGIESLGQVMHVLIPKNTPIPATKESLRSTASDNQSSFLFKVYQGERSRSTDNNLPCEVRLSNLLLAPRGVKKARIHFDIDADGILKVSAKESITGQKANMTITKAKERLTKRKMLEDAKRYKTEDQEYKKKVEAYIYIMHTKMKNDSRKKLISPKDLKKMRGNAVA